MDDRTKDSRVTRSRAAQDLNDIAALRKTEAWPRYYERRMAEELEKLRETVLHDSKLDAAGLFLARERYLEARRFSHLVAQDEAACKNLLEVHSSPDDD